MRFVQSAFALLLLGVPFAACTIFDARGDCEKNPYACEGGASGGTVTVLIYPPSCDDGVRNGYETGTDCGAGTSCGKCNGEICGDGTECKSGLCVDGVCCDAECGEVCEACNLIGHEGNCSPLPEGVKEPNDPACHGQGGCGTIRGYCLCDDGEKGAFEADVDCGGPCKKCHIGARCAVEQDCSSGHCVDGRCCSSACADVCKTCADTEHPGLCLPVPIGSKDKCPLSKVCGTAGLCELPNGQECSVHVECASNLCDASVEPHVCRACTSAGEGSQDNCTADESGTNRTCVDDACLKPLVVGLTCSADEGCSHGHCVDGVCCDEACNGRCMGCHNAYTGISMGHCAPIKAGLDPHGECNGTGDGAACSGEAPDMSGDSSCGEP